jgi:hypothetical protein
LTSYLAGGVNVDDETERRKLRLLSAIFSEIEKVGHGVKETGGEVYFEIGGQRLEYKVSEHYKQVQIQLSDEERRPSWNPAIATRTDLEPAGELCFEITTWIAEPIRKRWRDGKRKRLEEQLGDLIAGLIKAAAIVKEWERVRAEEERQRQELERERAREWSRNGYGALTLQGGVTFVKWRWRRARLVSSAPFSMNLSNARRKRWESTNCRRRFAIGSVGLESEPTQPIRFSRRPISWSMRIPQ